ncbi:A/G-specific DNA-adenine glycosylase [Desulfobaculum bizertense DSM 18034]|uniref:Adenine DNA glycosylase n=2 Tax=Desulfobaculum TaxID=1433996 RepID=A0A1T4WEX9_9BACT|nr:A/G-specific DNA-adenine glycosylase [Desulfobaculum bizertense DSM 18034]
MYTVTVRRRQEATGRSSLLGSLPRRGFAVALYKKGQSLNGINVFLKICTQWTEKQTKSALAKARGACFSALLMPKKNTFSPTLIAWFKKIQRPLPWRQDYLPYHVWISEIMLQQTQMDRAVPYFERWMDRFPTIASIADAPEDEILKYWEGLGYYTRARNIRKAALVICAEHGGEFPAEHKAILALPGIGPYTAGAIASLAFGLDVPAIDANVERVYARLFDIDSPIKEKDAKKRVEALSAELLPAGQARDYNQAVMELGALICTPRAPRCESCPVAEHCEARRLDIVAFRPVPGKKKDITPLNVVCGVLEHKGKIYIQKRPQGAVWGGLWEFPGGSIEAGESPEQAVVREFQEETGFQVRIADKISIVRHGYTRFRVTLHCYFLQADAPLPPSTMSAADECLWATPEQITERAFPAGHRKLIDLMRQDLRFSQYI